MNLISDVQATFQPTRFTTSRQYLKYVFVTNIKNKKIYIIAIISVPPAQLHSPPISNVIIILIIKISIPLYNFFVYSYKTALWDLNNKQYKTLTAGQLRQNYLNLIFLLRLFHYIILYTQLSHASIDSLVIYFD